MSDEQSVRNGSSSAFKTVQQEPVAWAVTIGPQNDRTVYEAFAAHQKEEAAALALKCCFGDFSRPPPLAGLFFSPTLSDKERKAIATAIAECESMPTTKSREAADTLRALLKRLG
jgi:hypothetical protein